MESAGISPVASMCIASSMQSTETETLRRHWSSMVFSTMNCKTTCFGSICLMHVTTYSVSLSESGMGGEVWNTLPSDANSGIVWIMEDCWLLFMVVEDVSFSCIPLAMASWQGKVVVVGVVVDQRDNNHHHQEDLDLPLLLQNNHHHHDDVLLPTLHHHNILVAINNHYHHLQDQDNHIHNTVTINVQTDDPYDHHHHHRLPTRQHRSPKNLSMQQHPPPSPRSRERARQPFISLHPNMSVVEIFWVYGVSIK
mmetsp:Transcript_489/g.781  ORF Transcript_489/g.781 Transcript_489/m.781 type:complete len:253 (-) Transcript_489:56-814(-)